MGSVFQKTALWALGFRPFFLLGLLGAFLLMTIWVLNYPHNVIVFQYFDPVSWHAHEMVFGFAMAVVVGFILTAYQNWANMPGVKGPKLILIAALWIFARILLAWPVVPKWLIAGIDLAFLPIVTLFLYPYLGRPEQRRNFIFIILLTLMSLANLAMHLGPLGFLPGFEIRGAHLGVYIIVLMIVVIGGRVIPFFTDRVVANYKKPDKKWVDSVAVGSFSGCGIVSVIWPQSLILGVFTGVTALLHLFRWFLWHDARIWRIQILWILYIGYMWLIIGLALTAAACFTLVPFSVATHAFTAGAIGTMIIGMISRVALGHTGRTRGSPSQPIYW